jgi:hypothetical protein
MYSSINPFGGFEHGSGRRGPPGCRHGGGQWPSSHGWGHYGDHHDAGQWHPLPFNPFGPHGGRGRGGFRSHGHGYGSFGPWTPGRRGWAPEDDEDYSSSSEDEEPKKKPDDDSSSDSSDSNSDSDIECHGMEKHHGGRGRRGGGYCPDRHHHRRRHHSRDHGRHGHHGGHGHHRRHGGGGHCWPPHRRHHHHGGRGPWGATADEDLPVEDASGFGSDYQVIQNDITAEMNNLQLQDDGPQDKSSKKCFKVALNADGFKVKDIRIRCNKNQLLVEGKQNSKTYLGTFQRSFAYTITIPAGVNSKKIRTKLGQDGVLRIRAKKSRETDNDEVEEIPIKE